MPPGTAPNAPVSRRLARIRAWLRRHPAAVTLAGTFVVGGALRTVIASFLSAALDIALQEIDQLLANLAAQLEGIARRGRSPGARVGERP